MARPTTRTEPLDHTLYEQLVEFCEEDHRSMKSFYQKFMHNVLSYETFQAAIRGELASDATCDAISVALDKAQWCEIWADRTTCPHCKGPLH